MKQEFLTHIAPSKVNVFRTEMLLKQNQDMYIEETISDCIVDWEIEPQFKMSCVETMGLKISRVRCQIDWVTQDSEFKDVDSGIIIFDTDLPEFKEWAITDLIAFDKQDGSIAPISVDIYCEDCSIGIA